MEDEENKGRGQCYWNCFSLYEKCSPSPCFAAADPNIMCSSDVNIYLSVYLFIWNLNLKVNWAAFCFSNSMRTPQTSGFPSSSFLCFSFTVSWFMPPSPPNSFCLVLFLLTCAVFLVLFLYPFVSYGQWIRDEGVCRRRDGNIQGNGCFRPDFITSR